MYTSPQSFQIKLDYVQQLSELLCTFSHSGDDQITQINAVNY